ncbi:MAG: helix-turn-helix domain-containing protein [Dehalococcoidia bacterium]|nr:helix-turn-helix domain-containing protein [Dehalococcoidia bacterium]
MQSTKESILSHLKRAGDSTVDALANEFGLARMTVRQHLAVLERDGLVVSREERQRKGRPHLLFSLSDGGQERFPKRYDRLANLVLEEVASLQAEDIAGLSAPDKKRLLLMRMADRVYRQHESRVRDKPLGERVAIVADILREEGGFAEWTGDGREFEIADHNCVYRRVVDSHRDLCDWHLSLLGSLLGREVECTQFQSEGADSCRFIVRDGARQAASGLQ